MSLRKHSVCLLLLVALGPLEGDASEDDGPKLKVLTEWDENEWPVRVDCENLGISGNGFGGNALSCSDRLSLFATFNCFPMKKEAVERSCPDWEGLKADIDWETVEKLIDERDAEKAESTKPE